MNSSIETLKKARDYARRRIERCRRKRLRLMYALFRGGAMKYNDAKKYVRAVKNNDKLYDPDKWKEAESAYIEAGRCINCGGRLGPWQEGSFELNAGYECWQCEEFYIAGEQPEFDTSEVCYSDADPGL